MNPFTRFNKLSAALLALLILSPSLFAAVPAGSLPGTNAPARIRVACVGDSITCGVGVDNPALNSYPAQLNRMLGDKWEVGNFGVSARTLLNQGDFPYQKEPALQVALAFHPKVVVILLGANDSKPQNWRFKDAFVPDYRELIGKFKALPEHPKIFICRPTPAPGSGNFGINEPVLQEELKLIDSIAKTEKVKIIDLHQALAGKDELIPDRVHPNAAGATLMAKTVYKALTGRKFAEKTAPDAAK